MSDDKNCVLDPLTCLCKVALLHFMPDKTRLAISHHVLSIQEHSYYQWLERMKNGDIRLDISNLNSAIIKCLKWYIIESDERMELDNDTTNSVKNIAHYAVMGFIKLKTGVYKDDLSVKIILQYFINMINDALDGVWDDDKYIQIEGKGSLSMRIKSCVDTQIINSISAMLLDSAKMTKDYGNVTAIVDCVHQLLLNRDNEFVKMMKEVNTTL